MPCRSMLLLAICCVALPASAQQSTGTPAPIRAGRVLLTPDNTRIQFVGTHVGDEPKPRIGRFDEFTGEIQLSPDGNQLVTVKLDIETDSLVTPIPDLTNHLKSTDFFEAREYPKAIFVSSELTPIDVNGHVKIQGALTLLGQSNMVVLPGSVNISEDGLVLNAKATVDRTKFGMDRFQDRVEKEVTIEVWVGNLPAAE